MPKKGKALSVHALKGRLVFQNLLNHALSAISCILRITYKVQVKPNCECGYSVTVSTPYYVVLAGLHYFVRRWRGFSFLTWTAFAAGGAYATAVVGFDRTSWGVNGGAPRVMLDDGAIR